MATTAIGNEATDLNSILQSAFAGGYVANGSGQTFTVSKTINIYIDSTTQGPIGLDLGGGTIVSNITDGSPVIKVEVGPNVDLRYLTFSNFTIQGNGSEGSGIEVVAPANDRWIYNFTVDHVTVDHVGGNGLDVQGSVFEGIVSNSWMTNNGESGAYFAHLNDGQASALRWYGGGLQNNGAAGMTLDNGTRDMSVDGAKFVGNQGGGIHAGSGITAVSNSEFIDNQDSGVFVQNYANFHNDTFTTSGAQAVGITGWLNGNATVLDTTSNWTGSGSDPTTLADLDGYGNVFLGNNAGKVVTGSSLSTAGPGDGGMAQVTISTAGVALPSLSAVTGATTAAAATTNGAGAIEAALKTAVATGHAEVSESSYTVDAPIVINLADAGQRPIDLDFGGTTIQSNVTNGDAVIEIVVGPGVNLGQLTLSNLLLNGNGGEGDGIKIVADGADRSIRDLRLDAVNVEHVGGIGLDVIGNVHGTVFDSWMHGNAGGGARFANSAGGGVADDLSWIGGGFRKNGVAGLILDNGAHDMTVDGAYFVENAGVGIDATSGITLVKGSGFENNDGTGAVVGGPSAFFGDSFSTWGPQHVAIGGYLHGGQVDVAGVASEYYGQGGDSTAVANLQGSGTLAITGGGMVIVGPGITVTGGDANLPIDAPGASTDTGTNTGTSTETGSGIPTDTPASDTATSDHAGSAGDATNGSTDAPQAPGSIFAAVTPASDQVTLSGTTGAAGDTVVVYDGNSWLGNATSNADGSWSLTADAPSNGVHSYGANAIGVAQSGEDGHGMAILGTTTSDILVGTAGADVMVGNGGNDVIVGGLGADTLTGGAGNVTFKYTTVADSKAAAPDVITDFTPGADAFDFSALAGVDTSGGALTFQGYLGGSGNLTLNAHSIAVVEVSGNTQVLVNTSGAAETVSAGDTHAADMAITLIGVHPGITSTDFHHP